MAKFTPQTLSTGFHSTSQINQNFTDIATALENTLSRDGTTPNELTDDLDLNGNRLLNLPAPTTPNEPLRKADIDTDTLNTVAGMEANIDAVAANETNINLVGANDADITTVANDIANVNTSAVNIAGINTSAANIANINTVAGISGDVTTVAGIAADVTAAANNIPLSNYTAVVAPAVTDDSNAGYSVGSHWVDTATDTAYVCTDAAVGAAVWINNAGGSGTVTSVGSGTGLTGGPITGAGTLNVDVGVGANQIVQLNGSSQLPAVDGSLLTNLPSGSFTPSSTDTLTNKTFDANGTGNSISNIDLTADVINTLPVDNGGTGAATLTSNGVLIGNGTSGITATAEGATGQVLTGVTGSDPIWAAPAGGGGKVLQVVTNQATGTGSSTSSTYGTVVSASLTPASASNKVLVMCNFNGFAGQAADTRLNINIERGSTQVREMENVYSSYDATNRPMNASIQVLDSPSTASPVTYNLGYARGSASGTVYYNGDTGMSCYITLIEIEG